MSYPAIQNASNSGPIDPSNSGTDRYNMDIEWATTHANFDNPIVDTANRYETTLRAAPTIQDGAVIAPPVAQTADITPRRTQNFSVDAGDTCTWVSTNRDTGVTNGSGTAIADSDSLVTAVGVPITTGTGSRLIITCI